MADRSWDKNYLGALGMWPFTNGLTELDDLPINGSTPIADALGKMLYASRDVEVYAGSYSGAGGSFVLVVPAGQPIGIVSAYGYDGNGDNWFYLYVDNLGRYIGKLVGAYFYIQDLTGTTYSLSTDIPSPVEGLLTPVKQAAKDTAKALAPELVIVGLIAAAVIIGPALISRIGK